MYAFLPIIILALVQGLTEFLPISSSGHLTLIHQLIDGKKTYQENLMMDVAVHVGTLLSVLLYFRKDISQTIHTPKTNYAMPLTHLLIASIPIIIAGFILHTIQLEFLRTLEIMAWMTLIFGIVLGFADKFESNKPLNTMTKKDAIFIGLSQCLALVPGVSRSGITMTTARFLNFNREDSARFSLYLSIIAIGGAGFLASIDLFRHGNIQLGLNACIAVIFSFAAGYIAISLMMKWLSHATFKPFVIYRIILGVVLLGLIYSGII